MESAANTIIKAIIMTAINSATPRLPPARDDDASGESLPERAATGNPHSVCGNRKRLIFSGNLTISTT